MSKSFTAYDVQKIRLEKLMTNIDKPVEIPQKSKEPEWKFPEAPDFVRNVMGSSAGAGSGEFHVYRHLRRKEFARQRFIEAQAKKEELDAEYRRKLEENKRILEEKTAKKRAKRLKKKQKLKKKKTTNPNDKSSDKQESQSEDESEKEETKEKSDEQQEEETKEKSDEQQEEETKE